MMMIPFIFSHFSPIKQSVGNQNKMKYKGFLVSLKNHFFSVNRWDLCVNPSPEPPLNPLMVTGWFVNVANILSCFAYKHYTCIYLIPSDTTQLVSIYTCISRF